MPASPAPAPVRLRFRAGAAEVLTPAGPVRLDGRASCAIGCVAITGAMPRARLAAMLWPDRDESRARANLRQLIHRIRRHGDLLDGEPLRLSDHVHLEGAWGRPRARDADHPDDVSPSPGPEQEGDPFELPDAGELGELDEWFTAERERRRAVAGSRARAAWRAASAAGRWDEAIAAALERVAVDPRSEEAYADLMRAQLEAGDPRGATRTYGRLRAMLERSFEASPSPSSVALAERATVAAVSRARHASLSARGPESSPAELLPQAVARRAQAGGWMSEGAAILRLAADAAPDDAGRGRILVDLAWLEHQLGRNDAARSFAHEGIERLQSSGGDADGWFVLGSIARHAGDGEAARLLFEQALARSRAQDDPAGRLALHLNLALVADSLGDGGAARHHYLAALPLARAQGDRHAEATVLNNLAHALLEEDEPARAALLLRRARSLAEAVDDRVLRAHVLDGSARAEGALGRGREARALASLAFETAREVGDLVLQVESLLTLARVREGTDGRAVAEVLAREALRLAWRHGYLPGTLEACLALAHLREAGPSNLLLNALVGDPRVPDGLRRRARALAAERRVPLATCDLGRAVEAALAPRVA